MASKPFTDLEITRGGQIVEPEERALGRRRRQLR